jgi:hypothetical protein
VWNTGVKSTYGQLTGIFQRDVRGDGKEITDKYHEGSNPSGLPVDLSKKTSTGTGGWNLG